MLPLILALYAKNEKKLSSLSVILTLPPLQGFSSRKTAFYLLQFLSNFFKYSFLNFPLSHPYNILAINLLGNSFLLEFCSFALSIFSCLLTSVLILSLNSFNTSFAFPRSSILYQVSCSAVNPFQHTKYFSTLLIFSYLVFFLLSIL